MLSEKDIAFRKVPDWKQQFHEVRTIGPEPELNKEGFWKKPATPKVKFQGEKEEKRDRADS
jgi:hypothetical protein